MYLFIRVHDEKRNNKQLIRTEKGITTLKKNPFFKSQLKELCKNFYVALR